MLVYISGHHGTGPFEWVRFLGHDMAIFHQTDCNIVKRCIFIDTISHHIGLYFYSLYSITDLIAIWLGMYIVNSWFAENQPQFSITR